MEALKQLEQNLIDAAKAKQNAVDAATKAALIYEAALVEAQKQYPALRIAQDDNKAAQEAASTAKSDYGDVKTATVTVLLELANPEDIKAIDAFGYRVEKKVWFAKAGTHLVERIAGIEAYGLLKVDEKALSTFIKANAIKGDNGYELPDWLEKQYENMIQVEDEIKPTISDPKISKLAK